ncbi:MAG: signal peptide peptidase SppA [Candidatus Marinimicrobia bacterium]|nr:signal peptide peptidase SppA [Candidatus Neomarinimicrobiota bacterium]
MYNHLTNPIYALLLSVIANFPLYAQDIEGINLPYQSVSSTYGASSMTFNPAGLGYPDAGGLIIAQTHLSGEFFRDTGIYYAGRRLGYSIEWLGGQPSRKKHTFGIGVGGSGNFSMGVSYSWFGSGSRDYSSLNIFSSGMIIRPFRWLSLAGTLREINGNGGSPNPLNRSYILGAGWRPFGENFTFTVDVDIDKFEKQNEATYLYGLEFWSDKGFSLNGVLDDDGGFELGVEIGFPRSSLRNSASYDKNGDFISSVTLLESRSRRRKTSLHSTGLYLELNLKGSVPDQPEGGFFIKGSRTTSEWVRLIERAGTDESIGGIILNIGRFDAGMATLSEIRKSLLRFKETGKKIIVYSEIMSGKGLYVSSAADLILMNPSGYLYFTGLSAQVTYYKGLLDKLGIEIQVARVGRYKSAMEPVMRDSMSAAYKEELEAILDNFLDIMYEGIAEGRGLTIDELTAIADRGPFTTSEALAAGLIDAKAYEDEIEDIAKKEFKLSRVARIKGTSFENRKELKRAWSTKPQIAILHLSGAIVPGASRRGNILGAKTAVRVIESLRTNDNVKAIILRIDSGGGTTLGSDIIWRELMRIEGKKPIIASFGDIAASGAYYISMPADTILAERTTLTGSIGIFMGYPNLRQLYTKLGIRQEVLKRGKRSDVFSDHRGWNEEEKEHFQKQMNELYDDFVSKVAAGRGLTHEEVDSAGMGRVWTGEDALRLGLIDIIGGIRESENIALEMTGLKRDDVEFVVVRSNKSLRFGGIDFITEFMKLNSSHDMFILETLVGDLQSTREILELIIEGGVMSYIPYEIEIE